VVGGGWLKAFKNIGTKKVCCIDHPSLKAEDLLIDENVLVRCDLSKKMPSPIKCDMVISTEFAEHVDESMSAAIVNFLTESSPIILFVAAIPGQGGFGHINEQGPAFWRRLLEEKGFEMIDAIRPSIIFDETIPYWFRQNLYLYVNQIVLDKIILESTSSLFIPHEFEIVHTGILKEEADFTPQLCFSDALKELGLAFVRAVKNRLKVA
jgi:hypothetical protein